MWRGGVAGFPAANLAHPVVVQGGVDLNAWLVADLGAVRDRWSSAIAAHVPEDRWTERADGGGSSIAALLLHVAVHQDLAGRSAIRGLPPLFTERSEGLGLGSNASPVASLQEAEDPAVTGSLDLSAVRAYASDVHAESVTTLAGLHPADLDAVGPASARLAELGGVTHQDAPWLHAMWEGKPVAWFVRWELIGHAQGHVGEMVSIRDRLGYRPF